MEFQIVAINQANLSRFRSNCDWDGDWGFPSILITKLSECVKPWENSCISINWNINFGAHVELSMYYTIYSIKSAQRPPMELECVLFYAAQAGVARVSDHIQTLIFHKSHMQTQTKSIPGGTREGNKYSCPALPRLRLCTHACMCVTLLWSKV